MNDIYEGLLDDYFSGNKETNHCADIHVSKGTQKRLEANGCISSLMEFGELFKELLIKAWGSNWGVFTTDTSKSEDNKKVITPQINYSTNLREYSSFHGNKPKLVSSVPEIINGKSTGYVNKSYTEFFDNIIEINFWDSSSLGAEKLMINFEELLICYADYLKNRGLSEIYFLKEVPAEYSLKKTDGGCMKCIYLFVRFERLRTFKTKTLENIDNDISIR